MNVRHMTNINDDIAWERIGINPDNNGESLSHAPTARGSSHIAHTNPNSIGDANVVEENRDDEKHLHLTMETMD